MLVTGEKICVKIVGDQQFRRNPLIYWWARIREAVNGPGVVVQSFNARSREAEAGASLGV